MTTVLYSLTGLPYSGKTTLRKELIKRFGFSYISIDEIMDEKDMWRKGHPIQEDWNVAYSEAYEKLKNLLRNGDSVIFDGASLKFKERETQRQIAEECGVDWKLIYVNTPKEVIIKRRLENLETKDRGHLNKREMEVAFGMFEEPTLEENPVIYNHEMSLDDWAKNNISK